MFYPIYTHFVLLFWLQICYTGGRGNVSFELLNTHSIPTLIIDPRYEQGRLTKKQKKWIQHRRKEVKRQGEDPVCDVYM